MSSMGATSFSGMPAHRTDAFPFPTNKELAKGTLRALIREAGLTVEKFVELL
jgi:hypothetical protein